MYRETNKYAARRQWHPRSEVHEDDRRPAQWRPPRLRRRITIEDFDGGEPVRHVVEMFRTNRIDSYRVEIDGSAWMPRGAKRIGWSRVLDWVRKAMPRLASQRNTE